MESNWRRRNKSTYEHLIFGKEARNIYWKRNSIFNQWCWSNWMVACRMQIHPNLLSCTKPNSKWIKYLKIRPDSLNLIEEKVGNNFKHIGTGKDNSTGTKKTINKWDLMKLKSFSVKGYCQ